MDYERLVRSRASLNNEGLVFPTEIMIDIETLGRKNGDVVLEAAAVAYNLHYTRQNNDPEPQVIGDYRALFNPFIQHEELGMGICLDTVKWWNADPDRSNQLGALLEEGGKVDRLDIAVIDFVKFLLRCNVEAANIWTRGNMDMPMLEGLIQRVCKWPNPWNYWQVRDLRTLHAQTEEFCSLSIGHPIEIPKIEKYTPAHSALADAHNQMLLHWELFQLNADAWVESTPQVKTFK